MLSVLPPGTVPLPSTKKVAAVAGNNPTQQAPSFYQTSCLQVVSSLSLAVSQSLPYPFSPNLEVGSPSKDAAHAPAYSVRLLTPSPTAKSPLFVTSTPTDKTLAASEGTTIWVFSLISWGEQIDELVDAGNYADALALLSTLDKTSLPDQVRLRPTAHRLPLTRLLRTSAERTLKGFTRCQYFRKANTSKL